MTKALAGWAVGSGILSLASQVFAWVVRRESDIDLSFSWFGSYVGSACVLLVITTMRTSR
jgi:hypothetical protein